MIRSRVQACLVVVSASFVLAAGAQDARPVAPPPPIPGGASAGPILDVDGKPARAGELPASTSPQAREAWQRVLSASLGAGGPERKPVTAFDLAIDLRYRGNPGQSNDLPDVRYQWLAPGYLRADTGRGRAHLRAPGPKGGFANWTIDAKNPDKIERIPIDIGRENAEDRRQLDEEATIAANFAALFDPRSIRVLRLASLAAPPTAVPAALRERAQALAWVELESPDLLVPKAQPGAARTARVALGIDPKTSLVQVAIVDDARAKGAVGASTCALSLTEYKPVDGFQVPFWIQVWMAEPPDPAAPGAEARWRAQPSMDMRLRGASLRAALLPQDFLPGATMKPSGG